EHARTRIGEGVRTVLVPLALLPLPFVGVGVTAAVQLRRERGPLLVGHDGEVDVDAGHVGHRGDRIGHPLRDLRPQRAPGNVARHHLEKLAGGGYLDVELARHESAGRPSKRYRTSADDSHLAFPPRRDDLLATLLAKALERLPVDEARTIAEEVGLEYGRAI